MTDQRQRTASDYFPPPIINSFTVTPRFVFPSGNTVTLFWDVEHGKGTGPVTFQFRGLSKNPILPNFFSDIHTAKGSATVEIPEGYSITLKAAGEQNTSVAQTVPLIAVPEGFSIYTGDTQLAETSATVKSDSPNISVGAGDPITFFWNFKLQGEGYITSLSGIPGFGNKYIDHHENGASFQLIDLYPNPNRGDPPMVFKTSCGVNFVITNKRNPVRMTFVEVSLKKE